MVDACRDAIPMRLMRSSDCVVRIGRREGNIRERRERGADGFREPGSAEGHAWVNSAWNYIRAFRSRPRTHRRPLSSPYYCASEACMYPVIVSNDVEELSFSLQRPSRGSRPAPRPAAPAPQQSNQTGNGARQFKSRRPAARRSDYVFELEVRRSLLSRRVTYDSA